MSGEQEESVTEHAASRVRERSRGDRDARKNELLFCRSSERGVQARKVALFRNVLKKFGQASDVKLLPSDVSNGEGRGDGAAVPEGAIAMTSMLLVSVGVAEALEVGVILVVAEAGVSDNESDACSVVDSMEELVTIVANGSPLSCRIANTAVGTGGGSRRSMCIFPLLASFLKSGDLYSR